MKKIYIAIIVLIAVLAGLYYLLSRKSAPEEEIVPIDYKNIEYTINGQRVKLTDGFSETEAAPGSASKIVTRYFGNEVHKDLNGDGRTDVAFLLTQETGGSGTFYYVVAALDLKNRYVGSEGYFLGDRIAPQVTESGPGNSIIVNYADRGPDEPMSARPSEGKSARLVLDPDTLQFTEITTTDPGSPPPKPSQKKGVVTGTVLLGPTCPVERTPPDPNCADKPYQTIIRVQPADSSAAYTTIQSDASGAWSITLDPGTYTFTAHPGSSVPPTCTPEEVTVAAEQMRIITLSCDTGIR